MRKLCFEGMGVGFLMIGLFALIPSFCKIMPPEYPLGFILAGIGFSILSK